MMKQKLSRSDCNHSLTINLLRNVAAMALGFILAGCVELLIPNQKAMDPSPEMLSAFPVADRCGEMFMDPGKNQVNMIRPVYLPQSCFSEKTVDDKQFETLVNIIGIDLGDKKIKFAGCADLKAQHHISGGVFRTRDELLALRAKRLKSRFHQPIQTQIDGRTYWVVHDQVMRSKDKSWFTLEIYDSEPTSTGPPLAVWVMGSGPYLFKGKVYDIPELNFGKDGFLVSFTMRPTSPPINNLLQGSTSLDYPSLYNNSQNAVAMETLMNETLIEWKGKGLPEYLQQTSAAKLKDMAIQLEKAWAKLDFEVKRLKDAADEDARQVTPPGQAAPKKKAPAGATSIATLIDQRKTILGVILGAVKQTAAQRAMEG